MLKNDHLSSDEIVLEKNIKHDIGIIVDRLVIKDNLRKRLADSVEIVIINIGLNLA